MLRAFAIAFVLTALPIWNSAAQTADPIPPPAQVDDAGISAWIDRYIEHDGWTIIGADGVAVALGGPGGVAVQPDGSLRATVRHEYYVAVDMGEGRMMRSHVQTRIIDCASRRNRIVSMTIFAHNNLQGESVTRLFTDPEWVTPRPNSLYLNAIDRICAAPRDGVRLQ